MRGLPAVRRHMPAGVGSSPLPPARRPAAIGAAMPDRSLAFEPLTSRFELAASRYLCYGVAILYATM
jgi:hypothetical protein